MLPKGSVDRGYFVSGFQLGLRQAPVSKRGDKRPAQRGDRKRLMAQDQAMGDGQMRRISAMETRFDERTGTTDSRAGTELEGRDAIRLERDRERERGLRGHKRLEAGGWRQSTLQSQAPGLIINRDLGNPGARVGWHRVRAEYGQPHLC